MKDYILEACVDSVESAMAAQRGGAVRLELCSNLLIGGTSPGSCFYREVKEHCSLPVHVLLRPRFGDFCYTDAEFRIIREEVKLFRKLGAEGVVIGILKPDGSLHMEQMLSLMEEAQGMSVTLHRAFDVCRDPMEALEQAKELGIHTILTSGQADHCKDGKKLLAELVRRAAGEIDIMIGSGVDASVLPMMYEETKARSYHMSGKKTLESRMVYRKEGVSMGLPLLSEYEIFQTDEEKIREAVEILGKL